MLVDCFKLSRNIYFGLQASLSEILKGGMCGYILYIGSNLQCLALCIPQDMYLEVVWIFGMLVAKLVAVLRIRVRAIMPVATAVHSRSVLSSVMR